MVTGAVQTWLATATTHVKSCLRMLSPHQGEGGTGKGGDSMMMMMPLPACCSRACSLSPRRWLLRITALLLLFSVLVFVFHYSVLPAATGSYNDDCYLSEERRERMRFVLRQVAGFLNAENVTYWLDYGTLLGAIREGDIIAHDGDMDLSRVADDDEQDRKMISRLKDKMKPVGIEVKVSKATFKDVSLDMFRWKSFNTPSGEHLFYKFYGYNRGIFITESISNYFYPPVTDPKELLPLRKLTMFGLTAKIPNRILDFLKRRFPLTWTYKSVPFKWKCYVGA